MRANPADLIGGFYQDDSLPWACQDTVNWIPEAAEAQGTRTPFILRDAPGLRPSVQVGTGPIRGMRNVEGKLLVVSGTQLYQVTNDLVAIPRGNIPGTGRVSMSHNSRSGGNQVVIVNGAAGYVYDTNALTLTRITDAGYPGAFVVDFVDGYMAQIEPLRRYWFHSELTQALDYNTLDRYPAEGQPDALVTLLVDHREVWVFGERTIEVFVNSGALTNTFTRATNTVIQQGCSAKFSPAQLDNSIFWLDDLGIVRRAQGYTPTRVSTAAIEKAIANLDWSRAFGYTITERGHAIYYLTFPDGQTFGYDVTTGLWHRRASCGLNRWRVNAVAYWSGAYMCGDFQQGLLYSLDWAYPFDGDLPHVRRRVTGVTHDNQNRVLVPYAELIVDNGRELVVSDSAPAQPDGPSITGNAPDGPIGEAYSYAYTPTGGTAPLVVSLWSGTLPPGLTLASSGVLSGTPATVGDYTWTVRVTDANGLYDDLADAASIGLAAAKLATDAISYNGFAPALTAGPSIGMPPSCGVVALSPNGVYCAFSTPNLAVTDLFKIAKYDTVTETWSLLADPAIVPTYGPASLFWPDDSTLVMALDNASTNDMDIWVYTRSGDVFTRVSASNDTALSGPVIHSVAMDFDGTRIAIGESNSANTFNVYDFDGTSLTNRRGEGGGGAAVGNNRLAFQSDAQTVYIAAGSQDVVEVYSDNGSAITLVDSITTSGQLGLYWYGEYLYAVGFDGLTTHSITVLRFTGGVLSVIATQTLPAAITDSDITPNGRYIALAGPTVPVYAVSTATPPVISLSYTAPSAGGTVEAVSWSAINE